jgi:hypothetical protein
MPLVLSGQVRESAKVRVRRRPVPVAPPARVRPSTGPRQEGTLWQGRMRTLSLRRTRNRVRRDRSGCPMNRG